MTQKDKRQKNELEIEIALAYGNNIIATLREPFLVLDKNLRVISANRVFYATFEVTEKDTIGRLLPDLGDRQWNIPKLLQLLKEIIPEKKVVKDYKVEHKFEQIGERVMILNACQLRVPKKIAGIIAAGVREEEKEEEELILLAIEDITERREIEAGLEKARKELEVIKKFADEASEFAENVINTVREPLIALDQDLRVVKVSRSFYEFFKVKPEDTVGQFIYDLGNKQWDIPKLRELLGIILLQKTTFDDYEVEHDFTTIGRRTMLLNARQIQKAAGKERIILLAIEDITARKQAEKTIKESEARFRSIALWNMDAIIITDSKGKIEYMNPAAERVFNRKMESFIGKDFGLPLVDGESAEIDIFRPGKESGVGDMHVVETEWLNKKMHLIVIRDITERKQAEETLKASETRYRRLFETAQDGILILDSKAGQITDVNPFLIDMLGYSHQEFVGKKLWDIGVFKDRRVCKKAFWELQTKGSIRYENLPLETKDRQRIDVEFVSNVYQINGEEVIQCNIRNITDRKRFEAIKDDFVSMVSHELRTPLTSIREAVSQTLDGILGEVTEQQRDILSMALSDVDRLARLINDLLDVSKIEAGKMKMKIEVCEMVALVKKLISSFIPQAKAKGLEMQGSFSKEKIGAYVDRDRITQVFSNLIGNAVKFTQKGRIQVSLLDRGDAIECSISDTGPGIANKDFAQLFDKFQQFGHQVNGEEKGTGLGLAVSKGIVELHRGRIWVESQVDAGTKFTFVLPKFTGKELISEGLKKAIKEGQPLSVLIFDIKNSGTIQKKMGEEKVGLLINDFWELIKENLRRDEDDLGIEGLHTILTILPGTEKESAASALERMSDLLLSYLLREKIEEEVDLLCEIMAYPDDGKTEEELFSRFENILATKREVEVSSK